MSYITLMGENDGKLRWETCPPELLRIIFKNLDYKTLLCCMTVSRRWKDIVVEYIEFHDLWEKIAVDHMINSGVTYKRKSTFGWKDVLINSMLWSSVSSAQIQHRHTYEQRGYAYELQGIKIHLYRDKLIVETNAGIKNYNITNCTLIKSSICLCKIIHNMDDQEIDIVENDYMHVNLVQQKDKSQEIHLYGKVMPSVGLRRYVLYAVDDALMYRLEDNICYILTNKLILWALAWDNLKWNIHSNGRYYGSLYDKPCAMHVYQHTVYIVTQHGLVLRECKETNNFEKVYHDIPQCTNSASNWMFFNKCDVVVTIKNQDPKNRIRVVRNKNMNHMRVECAGMTCATDHGEILFIGFKDGVVAICRSVSTPSIDCKIERIFCVTDFDETIEDPEIMALEVFEDKMSHHLLIATHYKIIQLLITYPFEVTTYYED